MILCFVSGIFGVTSYTIRISATQNYVPDEKKGRFNGAFNMLNTTGSFVGDLLAGALTMIFAPRSVLMVFMVINSISAIIIIGSHKNSVSAIYNTEL
jgi:MFS-type transporter involved in bile tolerance (Atg22 family)